MEEDKVNIQKKMEIGKTIIEEKGKEEEEKGKSQRILRILL